MKIGVVSDTHSLVLPQAMLNGLKGVELIIHAGDICDQTVIKELSSIAPVRAVCGNMDESSLRKKLPDIDLVNVGDVVIGLCHGHIGPSRDALSNAQAQFKGQSVHAVIYGHSHQAFNQVIDGVLYFNPGSPNDVIKAKFFSYGLITINGNKIKGEIVRIN